MLIKPVLTALLIMLTCQTVSATVASITPSTSANDVVLQQRQQVNDAMFANDFTIITPKTRWQRKEEHTTNIEISDAPASNIDFSKIIEVFSIIIKTFLVGLLLGFCYWLYLKRDIWLAWFARLSRPSATTKKVDVNAHISWQLAPMWQGLPEKSDLVNVVRQHLANQNWLLALSILYRGTLREILSLHDLAITRATTEHQCQWLLQKAETCQPQEAVYFQSLVKIWSQLAYGKKMPNVENMAKFNQTIEILLNQWQQLYQTGENMA